MRTTLLAITILVASGATAQEKRELPPDARRFLDAVNRPVIYRVPGMDKVRVQRDVAYKQVDGKPQLADIYRPAQKNAPIVVFVHGGVGPEFPIRPKAWGLYQSWGQLVAASGFVGVMFNHRLGFPEPRLREAASDLADLIAYIRENAKSLGGDPERICVAAYSAGGPLLSPLMRDKPPYIRCLVSIYNFLDITRTEHHSKFEPAEVVREFSPATHLSATIPPMLIVRAGNDQIPALNESIATFVQRAVEVNAPITLMIHPTAPHGFDNRTDDDRTREILHEVIDFMKWHSR